MALSPTTEFDCGRKLPPTRKTSRPGWRRSRAPLMLVVMTVAWVNSVRAARWRMTSVVVVPLLTKTVSPSPTRAAAAAPMERFSSGRTPALCA